MPNIIVGESHIEHVQQEEVDWQFDSTEEDYQQIHISVSETDRLHGLR